MSVDWKPILGLAGACMIVMGIGFIDLRAGVIAAGVLILADTITWRK